MLLMVLGTRYIYLVNESNEVNRVLVTYASSFKAANMLDEIDEAVLDIDVAEAIINEDKENERIKREQESNAKKYSYIKSDTNTNSPLANEIINYALQFVGNPYVYGGNSLTKGTDCSGFTSLVFAHYGISLPRVASSQGGSGRAVSVADRQPGDLILHGYNGRITHAALYIGDNKVVHALNSRVGIVVTNYDIMPIMAVRRVL